jgi:hypothetical protein
VIQETNWKILAMDGSSCISRMREESLLLTEFKLPAVEEQSSLFLSHVVGNACVLTDSLTKSNN